MMETEGDQSRDQKLEVASRSAIRSFMILSFFFGLGYVLIPYILPVILKEHEV